jgi:glucose-6-phosphate 1-dehydrogenase
MTTTNSDALVLFGVTGDLARKMIFPALYSMVKHNALKVPVIGVALPKWSLERLHKRVTDSVERSGGIDNQRALEAEAFIAPDGCWHNPTLESSTLGKEARREGPF